MGVKNYTPTFEDGFQLSLVYKMLNMIRSDSNELYSAIIIELSSLKTCEALASRAEALNCQAGMLSGAFAGSRSNAKSSNKGNTSSTNQDQPEDTTSNQQRGSSRGRRRIRSKKLDQSGDDDFVGHSSRYQPALFKSYPLVNDNKSAYIPVQFPNSKEWVPALYDPGSFASLLCENVAKDLNLQLKPTAQRIRGIGTDANDRCVGKVVVDIKVGWQSNWPKVTWYVLPAGSMIIPAIIGRSPLFERCTKIVQNLHSRKFYLGQPGEMPAKVPYVSDPRHEKFYSNFDDGNCNAAVDAVATSDLVELVQREIGATINIGDSPDHAREVAQIILTNRDAFTTPTRLIGRFKPYEAGIPTQPGKARCIHQWRVPEKHKAPLTDVVNTLKEQGILIPCPDSKGWNTPVSAVGKRDGGVRLVMNLNLTINKLLTETDTYSLPYLDESTEIPVGMKFFGSLDLASGYYNIAIKQEDQVKTSIHWNGEQLMFTRCPFGMRHSGNLFCRALHHALHKMKNRQHVTVFVDDLCIHTPDFQSFCSTLRELLQLIHEYGFVVKGRKVCLLFPEIRWLGRLISAEGQRPDPENVETILKMNPPTNFKGLQSLLGMLNWVRQFCSIKSGDDISTQNFSTLIRPITALVKINRPRGPFTWNREHTAAFNLIKQKLSSPEMIYFPDFSLPFVLCTDASSVASGWCLLQIHEGKSRIVRVGSKTFTPAQTRYSATEREALAICTAVGDCRTYIFGTPFTIRTDHQALIYIDAKISKNDKLARWASYLSQYDFVITYLPGEENIVADYLSRPADYDYKRPKNSDAPEPAGVFRDFHGFRIYVPSWVRLDRRPKIEFKPSDLCSGDDLVSHVASKPPTDVGINQLNSITAEQYADPAFATRRCRAIDAVEALQKHVIEIYPHPKVIASDRGQHFCSSLNALFAKMNNIHWHHHISFRPQSCGLLESRHRELKSAIYIATHTLSADWPTVLKRVVFVMNSATNKSTRQSPYKAVWGVDPVISKFDKIDPPPSGADIPTFLKNRKQVTDLLHDKIRICQAEADEKVRNSRPYIEPEELHPGDEVLLKKERSALAKSTRLNWVGPFLVCRSNGHVVLVSDSEGRQDWVHRSTCLKKVDRFPHLGEIPPFPNMQIPLRKTTPSPIVNSRPLNPPVPDHIQAPEAAPEAVPEKEVQNTPVGHDDTVFFDCETDLNSPRNSTNTPGAPIPEEPQVPLNPPENAPWRRKKAKKRQKALENQSAPQLEPTLEVNHEIRRLSHEIMVVLQRSARVISQSSFPKSKDGKKLTKLTQQLFCGDLAFSANQILMGSKMSLKAFLAAKQTLDEYQPMRPDAVKEKATSSKK
ncbi:unnamed protein product [Oikopleura dioica]|uniref:Reverse transcriptase n=1 Tax=Oikopleura dioica TaxID=34765 RepID=E4YGP7_OIKDI|nr:unnamed protein product [Oikopleura dioica]